MFAREGGGGGGGGDPGGGGGGWVTLGGRSIAKKVGDLGAEPIFVHIKLGTSRAICETPYYWLKTKCGIG